MSVGGGAARNAGVRIYRLPDYALVAEDREYADLVTRAESDPTGSRVAVGCFVGFVRIYDLSGLTGGDASSPRPISPVSKIRPSGGQRIVGLAFSPDGTRLAVGFYYTPKVAVLQVKGTSLEHVYSPDTTGLVEGQEIGLRTVAWSSDGRFLYGAGGYRVKAVRQVRKWADSGRGPYIDLSTEVDLPIVRILQLKAGGIAYASQDASFGVLDNQDKATILGPKAVPIYTSNYQGFLLSPEKGQFRPVARIICYPKLSPPLGIGKVRKGLGNLIGRNLLGIVNDTGAISRLKAAFSYRRVL